MAIDVGGDGVGTATVADAADVVVSFLCVCVFFLAGACAGAGGSNGDDGIISAI